MSNSKPDEDRTVIRPPLLAGHGPQKLVGAGALGSSSVLTNSTLASTSTTSSAASSAGESGNALRLGTLVSEFEITSVLGEGGFGIVYLAWDRTLERCVALKEYMPASMSARVGTTQVQLKSERQRDTFEAGLKSFVNEAKLLAHFDHPSLVKVHRFWEANGTAYMVMPFYEGVTLKDSVRALVTAPDEAWLLGLIGPLTEALIVIHAEECFHRDIAPDNILLLKGSGKPLLLDFGAARRVVKDETQALTVILKPGYAPIEQYDEVPGLQQGAWTDVYALAATVYWAIVGKTPPPALGRLIKDSYIPLMEIASGRYSDSFLRALDRSLIVDAAQRTQNMLEFRSDLGINSREINNDDAAKKIQSIGKKNIDLDSENTRIESVVKFSAPKPQRLETHKFRPRHGLLAGASAIVLLALALALWWRQTPAPIKPPERTPAASTLPVPPATTMNSTSRDTGVAKPALKKPRSAAEAFNQILAERSDKQVMSIEVVAELLDSGKNGLNLSIYSSQSGYLYLIGHRYDDDDLFMLFPGASARPFTLQAGKTSKLPNKDWGLAQLQAGRWHWLALLAPQPFKFEGSGWLQKGGAWVRNFAYEATDSELVNDQLAPKYCAMGLTLCSNEFAAKEMTNTLDQVVAPKIASSPRPAPSKGINQATAPAKAAADRRSGDKEPKNKAECATVLQQLSLGDASPELLEKLKSLGCQ